MAKGIIVIHDWMGSTMAHSDELVVSGEVALVEVAMEANRRALDGVRQRFSDYDLIDVKFLAGDGDEIAVVIKDDEQATLFEHAHGRDYRLN